MEYLRAAVRFAEDNTGLVVLFAIAVALLSLFALISILTDGVTVCAALTCMIGGGFGIGALLLHAGAVQVLAFLAAFCVLAGAEYLLVCGVISIRKRRRMRRAQRAEIERRISYTLPDRENSYVRARLQTALQVPDYKKVSTGEPVRLEYAKKLLGKVKQAPLSPAERLQAEEIGRVFEEYLQKERWDDTDLRAVNNTFSILLKLSAKYAVQG